MNSDKVTTITGGILALIIGAQIDFGKLFHGDPTEIGKAVAVGVTAVHGFATNRKPKLPI